MRRFCYKCGALEAKGGPLIHGLCQGCFMKEHRLLSAPAELELKVCEKCFTYFIGGRWHESTGQLESTLGVAACALARPKLRITQFIDAGERLLRPEQVKGLELQIQPRVEKEEVLLDVHARGMVHELQTDPHDERALIKVGLKWSTCDTCSLMAAGYYEAIVQVRGEKNLTKERLAEIKRMLQTCAAELHKRDRAAYIAKIDDKPKGLDFYVNPIGLARGMAKMLKSKFGAKLKETSKLIGTDQAGRRKFRITMLARLPSGAVK